MSDMQIAATQQRKPGLWPHLSLALSAGMLVAIALPYLLNFNLAPLTFFAIAWVLHGIGSLVVLWRAALRSEASISIAPGGLTSLIFLFNMLLFTWLGMQQLNWPGISLFRAPEATPVVAEGELLYGLKYTPTPGGAGWSRQGPDGRVQRGQLVLARIGGEESLVRVLAVQGDIFAIADDALLINGSRVSLRSLTEPWDRDRLSKLVGDIATAGESAGDDALDQLVQKQAKVVRPKRLLVARDAAFLKLAFSAAVPVLEISDDDVVLTPWAKFWSIGDHPGKDSDLAQPDYPFFGN